MKKELLGKKELEIDDLEHSYPIHIEKKKKKRNCLFWRGTKGVAIKSSERD